MKRQNLIILGVLITLAFAVGGGLWWQSRVQAASNRYVFEATGTIEARKVSLAPEFGGKVNEVMVKEGQRVKTGQELVRLDQALLDTQQAQARAALRTAQANLALLEAGPTQDQIQAVQSALAQAEANLRASESILSAATANTPPEKLAALRAELERARAHYQAIRTPLASNQIEALRAAQSGARENLTAAEERRAELAKDNRNPDFIIASAEATVTDTQNAFDAAQEAYTAAGDDSIPYYLQVEQAQESLKVAQANLSLAEARRDGLEDEPRSTAEGVEAAQHAFAEAQSQVDTAQAAYDTLTSGADTPHLNTAWDLVQKAQSALAATLAGSPGNNGAFTSVEALMEQVEAARAARNQAAANLAEIKNGAQQEQIDAAQAQVDSAQAQVDALEVQRMKLTISAPIDGVVMVRSIEPGEVVMPGATLLEIGRLDTLELTVFVPEDQLGRVALGQMVTVDVDAYPERSFAGVVLRVSDEAEFTPTNVLAKDDRDRMVYAVKIELDNPDLALKPGMIATAGF